MLPERPNLPGGLPLTPPAPAPAPVSIPGLAPETPVEPVTGATVGEQIANTYASVGSLTADQLIHGHPDQFAHLEAHIVRIRSWLQSWLISQGKAEQVASARLNPTERLAMTAELDRALIQYMAKETVARGVDRGIIIASVINEVLGLGPIEPLWTDPRITEVMVNGPTSVYVEMGGLVIPVPGARFRDREHLLDVCQQILMPLNRRVDQKSPLADGRLADGSRVNIVHYAVAPSGPLLTIRRFPESVWTLKDLVENNSLSPEMAVELAWLVSNKASTVVVGGTGSGKTSLLNALSSCISPEERVITVEDSLELRLHPQAHVAAMEARPASASGDGEVRIRDLVKNALRMRPTRIVVGEVRDASALDMLQAMNTGHEGSMTTVHANGAEEAVNRLAVLVAMGGEISEERVGWLIGDAVNLFVVQRRYEDGSRRVQGIYEVPSMRASTDGQIMPIPLWEWEHTDTDETGTFIGHYVKRNDISDELARMRGLRQARQLTLDDVYRMSELPETMKGQA